MKINPPSGPTDISASMHPEDLGPADYARQFIDDVSTVNDSLNQTIALINQGGSDSSIKKAYNHLMSLMTTVPKDKDDFRFYGEIKGLGSFRTIPDYTESSLEEMSHLARLKNVDFSDKGKVLSLLNTFRDNLLDLTAGFKTAFYQPESSNINTSVTKSSFNQDFQDYEEMLQAYIDGKVAPNDMEDFKASMFRAFKSLNADMFEMSKSLTPAQDSFLMGSPSGFVDLYTLNTNFFDPNSESYDPTRSLSIEDATKLMTAMKGMQNQVNTLNF